MDGTWVWCPECGKMTWIPKCDKTGICFNCSAFVDNPDWEGWDQPESTQSNNSGCGGVLMILLSLLFLPVALIGCFIGL